MITVPITQTLNDNYCYHFTKTSNLPSIEEYGILSIPPVRENMTVSDRGNDTIYFSKGLEGFLKTADVWLRWEYDVMITRLRQAGYEDLEKGHKGIYPEVMEKVFEKFFNDEQLRSVLLLNLIEGEDPLTSDYSSNTPDFKKVIAKEKGYLDNPNMMWEYGPYSDLESLRMEDWNMNTHMGEKTITTDKIIQVTDSLGNTDALSMLLESRQYLNNDYLDLSDLDSFIDYATKRLSENVGRGR